MSINSNAVRILISNVPEVLRAAAPDVTIEAEYGDVLVEGTLLTLAHHGDRGHNPPPSTRQNQVVEGVSTIGVSHMDLDTLGGILSVLGLKPEAPSFWELVGFVDTNGVHKLAQSGASKEDLDRLYAFYSQSTTKLRVSAPYDGSVADITEQVHALASVVSRAILNDETLLEEGQKFKLNEGQLNASSFRSFDPATGIIMRQSTGFVNHLYVTPSGEIARAVVSQNPSESLSGGAITASLADPIEGIHVGKLLGEFFSPEAGGHAGIGGSERGKARPFEDALAFAAFLASRLP